MSKKTKSIITILDAVVAVSKSPSIQKALLGSYSDGTPRSLTDALDGEVLSPKQREEYLYKKKKKKHKKKNKKKKKKIKIDTF